jgi:hypothetical protein
VTILRKKFSPPVEVAARTSKVLLMIVPRIGAERANAHRH